MGKTTKKSSSTREVRKTTTTVVDLTSQAKEMVEQLLGQLQDRPLYMGTILNAKLENRVLAIGRFRIVFVKMDKKKPTIQGDGHVYDLKKLTVEHSKMTLEFSQKVLTMVDLPPLQLRQIFQSIITNYALVTFGWPESAQFILNLRNPPVSLETKRPTPEFGGYREAYAAYSNMIMKPASRELLDYVGYCFDKELSLSHVQDTFKESYDFGAILAPLKYNAFFTKIEIEGCQRPQIGDGLSRVVMFNRTIQALHIVNCGINAQHMDLLRKAVENNRLTKLCDINLSWNTLADAGFQSLANLCQMLPLRSLELAGCGSGPKGVESLLQGLIHNPRISKTLRKLDLSGNKFGASCSNTLAGFLSLARKMSKDSKVSWTLRELRLVSSAVNCAPIIIELYNSCNHFDALEVLDFSGGQLDDSGATNLSKIVNTAKSLNEVQIGRTSVKPLSLAHVMQSFLKNSNVKQFAIGGGHIAHSEAALRDILPIVKASAKDSLSGLHLPKCELGDSGMVEILGALSGSQSLEKLTLSGNYKFHKKTSQQVGNEVGRRIMQLPKLKVFIICGIDEFFLGAPACVALLGHLSKHQPLEELDISNNRYGNDGAMAFASFMAVSKVMKVKIDDNKPKKDGLEAFGKKLAENKMIIEMGYPNNDSSCLGKKAPQFILDLTDVVMKNRRVYMMHLKKKKEEEERAKRNKPKPVIAPPKPVQNEPVPVEPIPLQKPQPAARKDPIILNNAAPQQAQQPNINITIQAPPQFMQQGSNPNVMNMFPAGMMESMGMQDWNPDAQMAAKKEKKAQPPLKLEPEPAPMKKPEVIMEKKLENPLSKSTVAFFQPDDIDSDDDEGLGVVNMMKEIDQEEAIEISKQFEAPGLEIASDDELLSD